MVVAETCVTCRILEDALTVWSTETVTCNVAAPKKIMTEELFAVRKTTVTWNALIVLTHFVVGAVVITQTLGTLALSPQTHTFVKLVAVITTAAVTAR